MLSKRSESGPDDLSRREESVEVGRSIVADACWKDIALETGDEQRSALKLLYDVQDGVRSREVPTDTVP
jgi:hypothetical protein